MFGSFPISLKNILQYELATSVQPGSIYSWINFYPFFPLAKLTNLIKYIWNASSFIDFH